MKKPTKAQKLRWIEDAMLVIEDGKANYTCAAFHFIRRQSFPHVWYSGVLAELGLYPHSVYLFDEFDKEDQRAARLLWLAFLHEAVRRNIITD